MRRYDKENLLWQFTVAIRSVGSWNRFGDYESAEPDEYGFRSRDLRTINETLCDGFGQTGRNLVEIRRGIDDLGDRLARQNRRGRRRPGRAYDERKIDAVRQVWALANESAEAKQSLNTRMTFAVALRYGKPILDRAGITTREEFARIRHAISCRESRARIKALEATRAPAPTTRTCAPEDLPNSQMRKSGENGIISSMKYGATTLALMAAMLCGLGVFGAPVSASESIPPAAEVSVAANGDPQKNPQKILEIKPDERE